MPDNHEVLAKLHQALEAATRCSTEETTVNYESLNEALQQLATLTKRIVQSSADGATLARKLRAGDPLTSDERVRLRLLIVGDADYYLKYDEEFERCKAELSKIVLETSAPAIGPPKHGYAYALKCSVPGGLLNIGADRSLPRTEGSSPEIRRSRPRSD